jgi:hypothetical protein
MSGNAKVLQEFDSMKNFLKRILLAAAVTVVAFALEPSGRASDRSGAGFSNASSVPAIRHRPSHM